MLAVAFVICTLVTATSPQVNFPVHSQLPPVARIGEYYSFQFAANTFRPESDDLQYSLISNPSWLSLNGRNRTLWGTPGTGDQGTATFTLSAAGEAGAVANMEIALLVTDAEPPKPKQNISEYLSSAGQLSGPQTVNLLPSKPFDLQFPMDTFGTSKSPLIYRAILADRTPLPAWISFDATTLHFAGIPPAVGPTPQVYEILLVASQDQEYAASTISFKLIVSEHRLLFKPLRQDINIAKDEEVDIKGLRKMIFLDDVPIKDQELKSASAELPSWLKFDDRMLAVTGKPPPGVTSQDITVTVEDTFGDTAEQSIHLRFEHELLDTKLETLNITKGRYFDYRFPPLSLSDDERVSLDLGPLAEWLDLDANAIRINGTLPEDMDAQSIEATLSVHSSDGNVKDSQTFLVEVSDTVEPQHPGAGRTSNNFGNLNNQDDNPGSEQHDHDRKSRAAVIAGSVVGALLGSAILVAFTCILCRRKKNTKGYISPKSPRSPRKTDISRPILIHDEWDMASKHDDHDLEKGDGDETLREKTPEQPPKLNLPGLDQNRKITQSPVTSIGEGDSKILSASDDFSVEAGPSHRPHDSMRLATAMARRESSNSDAPAKHRRRNTAVYRDSHQSAAPLSNRRLSGLGHGRHTYSPGRSSNDLSYCRLPLSRISNSTVNTSILSRVPSAIKRVPSKRHSTQATTGNDKKLSIRMVPENGSSTFGSIKDRHSLSVRRWSRDRVSACPSPADERPLDDKRWSHFRRRPYESPFFGASSSRVSSSSYRSPAALNHDGDSALKPAPPPLAMTALAAEGGGNGAVLDRKHPDCLTICKPKVRKPADTPTPSPSSEPFRMFTGSLRKPPTPRSFTGRNTTLTPTPTDRNRVYKQYTRNDTTDSHSVSRRGSGTRQSVRAQELKSSINSLTGSKIYEDTEMSESVYSTEEEDIEEYEKRTTIKPDYFALPPLDPYRQRRGNRDSTRVSKDVKRHSGKELKKISERDPTPFAFSMEHGGKENQPSTRSMALPSRTSTGRTQASPERPKTIAVPAIPERSSRRPQYSRQERDSVPRLSTRRNSPNRPLSRHQSKRSRAPRTQSVATGHSRTESRHSNKSTRKNRDRSRTQSSAFPHFDMSNLPETLKDPSATQQKDATAQARRSRADTNASIRDMDGNIINYGLHENPTIEELASSSIGFRTENGQINSSARQSRLVQQISNSNRNTTIIRPTTASPSTPRDDYVQTLNGLGLDLGFNLLTGRLSRDNTPDADHDPFLDTKKGVAVSTRERTPLSVLGDGNGGSPERGLRVVEGKGKRPVSREVDSELKAGASRKGRMTTWGSLKAAMGRGYWDGRDRDMKAFL